MSAIKIQFSGQALKQRRKFLLLNLSDVAKQVGISNGQLSQIENDKRPPNTAVLKKLKEVLKIKKIEI